jgi:hypothetical protein
MPGRILWRSSCIWSNLVRLCSLLALFYFESPCFWYWVSRLWVSVEILPTTNFHKYPHINILVWWVHQIMSCPCEASQLVLVKVIVLRNRIIMRLEIDIKISIYPNQTWLVCNFLKVWITPCERPIICPYLPFIYRTILLHARNKPILKIAVNILLCQNTHIIAIQICMPIFWVKLNHFISTIILS